MNLTDITAFLTSGAFATIIAKGIVVLLLLFYLIFALVMVRQVSIMMEVVEVPVSPILRLTLYLHVALVILVLLFALIII